MRSGRMSMSAGVPGAGCRYDLIGDHDGSGPGRGAGVGEERYGCVRNCGN